MMMMTLMSADGLESLGCGSLAMFLDPQGAYIQKKTKSCQAFPPCSPTHQHVQEKVGVGPKASQISESPEIKQLKFLDGFLKRLEELSPCPMHSTNAVL